MKIIHIEKHNIKFRELEAELNKTHNTLIKGIFWPFFPISRTIQILLESKAPENIQKIFIGVRELLHRNLVLPDKEHNSQYYPVAALQLFPRQPV